MQKAMLYGLMLLIGIACQQKETDKTLSEMLTDLSSMTGTDEYLASPFVTAGDQMYLVGDQAGTFPDHGWHVAGEMGGLWAHPIKLMDGFVVAVQLEGEPTHWVLDNATQFVNFPVGNELIFESADKGLKIKRTQFIPDGAKGLVVEISLSNQSSEPVTLDLHFTALVDLTPVWLAEELDIKDGSDQVKAEDSYIWAKDGLNDWFTAWTTDATDRKVSTGKVPYSPERKGLGTEATMTSSLSIPSDGSKTIRYFMAGSDVSRSEAVAVMEQLQNNHLQLLQDKIARYGQLDELSRLDIPDPSLKGMYQWTKYNTDWLMRDVPGLGRGLSAGMADYPWWFGADNCYSLQGLLATGQHEEVLSTIDLIVKLSKQANGDNGRIMHEASTNGVVFNPGNLNETPHFTYLLWRVFEWTGDKDFLQSHYEYAQAGLEWIMEQDHDGNGYADGPGMMEIPGLHTEMIDVVVYTQQAAWALGQMAEVLERAEDATKYDSIANALRTKINSEWWSEKAGSYADFRATRTKTLELIDAAIIRSDTIDKPWAVEELQQTRAQVAADPTNEITSRVVYHNWVVNTPMEMGIADRAKAQKALAEARKYRSKYGSYVTGLDRDESQAASSKWEVFSYVGAVMTLPTGVQALAEANYGNTEESYEYMKQLTNSFSYALPGSTYEVSPDYGMMSQAWNIYAVAVPIVTKYFGFEPQAYQKHVVIRPQMPERWDNASLENIRVGDNSFSIKKTTEGETITFDIDQIQDWEVRFYPPAGYVTKLDNATASLEEEGYVRVSGKSKLTFELVPK